MRYKDKIRVRDECIARLKEAFQLRCNGETNAQLFDRLADIKYNNKAYMRLPEHEKGYIRGYEHALYDLVYSAHIANEVINGA